MIRAQTMVMGPQTIANLEESPAGSKILKYVRDLNRDQKLDEKWVNQLFSSTLIKKNGIKGTGDDQHDP